MPKPPTAALPDESPSSDVEKTRHCLKCNAAFASAWYGERICRRCKSTLAWRSSAAPRPHNVGGRRSSFS